MDISCYLVTIYFLFFILFCFDNISAVVICWSFAEILDTICGFTRIFTVIIIGKYIATILIKLSWSEKCGNLMYRIIFIIFLKKMCYIFKICKSLLQIHHAYLKGHSYIMWLKKLSNISLVLWDNSTNTIFCSTISHNSDDI